MKGFVSFGIFCTTLFSLVQAEEFPVQEICEMAARDLEARKKWVTTHDISEIRDQEIENTSRLKEIIARYGMPTGYDSEDLVDHIQQLVLHSSDVAFQKQFLEMIPFRDDLWSDNFDVLTDRVLLRQGMAQRYGTHLYHKNGTLVPYPIEDLETLDRLREELDEPPFAVYLEIMREVDRAFAENNDSDLYKIVFNMMNGFYEKSSDFLYYASFEPNNQPQDEGKYLAFADPALAAAFALCETTPVNADALYEKATQDVPEHLLVLISPRSIDDAIIFIQTPLYMYIIPRGDFVPHETYGATFMNRFLVSPLISAPVAEIQCNSVLETLLLGGSKIKIYGAGIEYEYKDPFIRDKMQQLFFFDATLENENFTQM